MKKPRALEWVRDAIVFYDATPGAVQAALTEWRQKNAGRVRNIVPHEVKREPIEISTPPRGSRVEPNKNAFSLLVEFERPKD